MRPRSTPTSEDAAAARAGRRKKARKGGVSIAAIRLAELNRLFAKRYGTMLPDDDAGRDDAFIAVNHITLLGRDVPRRIADWCQRWAPWMDEFDVEALTDTVIARPRRWRADTLAQKLNLTESERRQLRITTIGAVGLSKAERDEWDRERRRAAEEARRRTRGAKPRRTRSTERSEPWKAEGISRRTWFRRRRRARGTDGTGACPPYSSDHMQGTRQCH